jgi:hypothetical protein
MLHALFSLLCYFYIHAFLHSSLQILNLMAPLIFESTGPHNIILGQFNAEFILLSCILLQVGTRFSLFGPMCQFTFVSMTRHRKFPGLRFQWQRISECIERRMCSLTSRKWIQVWIQMLPNVYMFMQFIQTLHQFSFPKWK